MKQFEFESSVSDDDTLSIPKDLAAQIARDRLVRVVVLVPDTDEDQPWADLTASQFLQGYAESDAIYDDLSGG